MKTILGVVFLCLSFQSIAQIETIDAIVTDFDIQIALAVDEEMEYTVPLISTHCPLSLPAIGLVNHKIDLYFDLNRIESDQSDSGMENVATIRKVNFDVVSGSYNYEYTFHFNAKGAFIFYSRKAEDAYEGCNLNSYYFDKEKCIQIRSELFATEFCELPDENQPEIRTELSEIEKYTVKTALDNAEKFKKLLAIYVDLMLN